MVNRMRFFNVMILLFLCLLSMTACRTVEKKMPEKVRNVNLNGFSIVIADRAALPEVTAAQELQKVLKREIVTMSALPQKNAIIIGDTESALVKPLLKKLDLKKSGDDVIVQAMIGGNLILTGSSPRAALYSVYDFMQRQMGVRWAFDGENGTFYTKNHFSVPENFYRKHQAGFRFRNMGYTQKNSDESKFFNARNFAHEGDFRFGGERYYGGETIQPYRSDFKDHPEYFAVRDGVRYLPPPTGWSWVINGCWSNQGFTDLCLKRIREGIRRHHANHISLHPADSSRRCECEKCVALIDPDASSRWYRYNAQMLRELKKDFPDLRYSVLAYQEYLDVPAIDVEEVEFVEYCQYTRCFIHKIGDPRCATNEQDFARLARWEKEKKVPLGIWDYTYDVFSRGFNIPVYRFFADEIKNFHSRNFVKLFIEGGPCIRFSRSASYVALQLMWDPARDPEEVMQEYCKAVYGPAWKMMYAYHIACAENWDNMNAHLSQCFNNPGGTAKLYLTPALIALAEKTFADSISAVTRSRLKEEVKSKHLAAIIFEKETFQNWYDLHKKMKQETMLLTAYQDHFSDLAKHEGIAMKGAEKARNRPEIRLAAGWNENAILLRVSVKDPAAKALEFKLNKDGKMAYGAESVEIFLQAPGQAAYYHFAAGRNGDFYDGEGMNGKWDGDWSYRVISAKDDPANCVFEITIPFRNFKVSGPGPEPWKIMVIRNGSPAAQGLPAPRHHDIGAGAELTFSNGKRPE